jgi:hypothetical protein
MPSARSPIARDALIYIDYGLQQKGSLMPPLTPARRSVQIGRTGSAIGKLACSFCPVGQFPVYSQRCSSTFERAAWMNPSLSEIEER